MAYQKKTWVDVPDENNPPVPNPPRTEAAEFNRMEQGIADAHSQIAAPGEAWHQVGAVGEPAFQNAWVNFLQGEAPVTFYKDPDGIVHLRGLAMSGTLANGTTGTIFTLPAGYRPPFNEQITTIANGAFARCVVDFNGNVIAVSGSSIWFSIGNIHFRVS